MQYRSIFFLFFLSFNAFSQSKIQKAFQNFIAGSDMQYASVSFSLIDIEKNQTVCEHNADLSLPCASTMKAITTGTALSILGEDFKFETYLEHDGFIKDGVLNGNIYLRGTGDPCLASPYMEDVPSLDQLAFTFSTYLKKFGIKKINGNVIGDGSYFESATTVPTWQWMDTGNGYGSGVTGINIHDNLYLIGLEQKNQIGAKPELKQIKPEQPGMNFFNELTSAEKNSGDNSIVFAAPFGSEAWIRGTIPSGSDIFWIQGAITDPELYAAQWLLKALQGHDLVITGKALSNRLYYNNNNRKLIYTHYSPSLSKILKHTNAFSRNMYCEALVKTVGKKIKNEGSQSAGTSAIIDFWKNRGVDTRGFFMEDGSGLSMKNAVNSKTMAQIMRKMHVDAKSFPNFPKLLAISGENGNMRFFGKNTILQGNLHGKGGTMIRIRCMTGFFTSRNKRKFAFSVLVNNFNCSGQVLNKRIENLLVTIAESQE